MPSRKIRNEKGKVVGRYLFEGEVLVMIQDKKDKEVIVCTVPSASYDFDLGMTREGVEQLRKEAKAILKMWPE